MSTNADLPGQGSLFSGPTPEPVPFVIGKYHGANPTESEREAGERVEVQNRGRLKRGTRAAAALRAFRSGNRMTAYDASEIIDGDHHGMRREARRLFDRGLLEKVGHLPNSAPRGSDKVDAYRLTAAGRAEIARLDG